tara:strand:- start:129 stop:356 length:228 start_codon:yes stop_codon:yes gene_type:complete
MINIQYHNGIITEHETVNDAMFSSRNVCDVHRTTIKQIYGCTMNEMSDLRTGIMLLNANLPVKIDRPIQLSLNLK